MIPEQLIVVASLVSGCSRLSAVLVLPSVPLAVTAALGSTALLKVCPEAAGSAGSSIILYTIFDAVQHVRKREKSHFMCS